MIPDIPKDIKARLQHIPPLPQVAQDAMDILDRPDVDLRALEQTLHHDPALTTQMLRVANSPFYGLTRQISSLHDACLLLGIYTVRNVVLTAAVMTRFPPDNSHSLDRQALWKHAIGTAIAAKVIAIKCKFDQELAFTCGLLHDIGKLVLDCYFPEETAAVVQYRDRHDCLLRDAEMKVLGFDHSTIGAWIAKRWNLPPMLVHAIAFHHVPDQNTTLAADIVHVADVLCRGLDIGDGGDSLIPALHAGAIERVNLDWNNLPALLNDIEELQTAAQLMGA